MFKRLSSEEGHLNLLTATVLAAVGLVVLTFGAVGGNSTLAWIGGITAAVLLVAQFFMVHAEFGSLWERIEELEKKSQ